MDEKHAMSVHKHDKHTLTRQVLRLLLLLMVAFSVFSKHLTLAFPLDHSNEAKFLLWLWCNPKNFPGQIQVFCFHLSKFEEQGVVPFVLLNFQIVCIEWMVRRFPTVLPSPALSDVSHHEWCYLLVLLFFMLSFFILIRVSFMPLKI